jgi:transposase InsO family protein
MAPHTSVARCWHALRSVASGSSTSSRATRSKMLTSNATTVRYAWLAGIPFDSIEQVQDAATRWPWTYNHERPNMALGGITPMQKLALAA